MPKWVRLWGKKRGERMSGWWVVGSVSEAAFFGGLFLLGITALTIVVTWQVFWPQSSFLRIGVGFWLMVITSSSFVVIGLTGFTIQLSRTLASPELRSALVDQAKRQHKRRSEGTRESGVSDEYLPSLRAITDSPGVKLSYRLALQSGERTPVILSTLFSGAWNTMLAILIVIAVQGHVRGTPDWFLTILLLPFGVVSFFATCWFFRLFRRLSGLGPTAVEISDLPLLPGETYRLYLCQYGRTQFSKFKIRLVGYEEATFQQGTDIRTERVETASIESEPFFASESHTLVAEPEKPLELDCKVTLPADMMHSFQGQYNAILWKIVVEGEATKWPSFCRSFPVVVYPRDSK